MHLDGACFGLAEVRLTWNPDRQVVEAVAVEVAGGECAAESVGIVGRIGGTSCRLAQDVVRQPLRQAAAGDAVADDDDAAVRMKAAEVVVKGNASGEIVRSVAIEITHGECRSEPVSGRGDVEQQVLVGEALGSDRGKADAGELSRGGGGQGQGESWDQMGDRRASEAESKDHGVSFSAGQGRTDAVYCFGRSSFRTARTPIFRPMASPISVE